jgi:type I restriction enzyme R subunit
VTGKRDGLAGSVQARIGALGAGTEWFNPWRTIAEQEDAPAAMPEMQVVLQGVFERRRFLHLLRYFIVFEDEGAGKLVKKLAGYHQFHAVNAAAEEALRASHTVGSDKVREILGRYESGLHHGGAPGDRRVGVVWHTQDSSAGSNLWRK